MRMIDLGVKKNIFMKSKREKRYIFQQRRIFSFQQAQFVHTKCNGKLISLGKCVHFKLYIGLITLGNCAVFIYYMEPF